MSGSFLSPVWYRVAATRPLLRARVSLHLHRFRGRPCIVLHDRDNDRVHRLGLSGHRALTMMDGSRTLDAIWSETAAALADAAPSQTQMIALVQQLYALDLLEVDAAPDVDLLLQQRSPAAASARRWQWQNPMLLRLPLLDPAPFLDRTAPFVTWCFGPAGFLLWLATVVLALVLALQHRDALLADVVDRVTAQGNLVLITLAFVVSKALHELGHAYAARRYGAPAREMGLMLFLLMPSAYVDVSSVSALPRRNERIAVSAAGMAVDLFVGALGVFVWLLTEPGAVQAVAWSTIMVVGATTVFANGNPLLRYDGYYILADLVAVPNLATRSSAYWRHRLRRWLGEPEGRAFRIERGERPWLFAYAPLAWACRLALLLGLAFALGQSWPVLAVALVLWAVAANAVVPITKGLGWVLFGASLRGRRLRGLVPALGLSGLAALALLAIPVPLTVRATGVVWLPENATVRAGADGFVLRLRAAPSARVDADTVLIDSDDPELGAETAAATARVAAAAAKYDSQQFTDRGAAAITQREVARERAQLADLRDRERRLTIASSAPGVFTLARAQDLPGQYVHQGDVVGYVLPAGAAPVVRAIVRQEDVQLVRERLRGIGVRFSGAPGRTFAGRIIREVPGGSDALPSRALAEAAGGSDPADRDGMRALERVFQLDIELPLEADTVPYGSRAAIRFACEWEPLGHQLARRVRQLFLAHLDQ